MWLGEILPLVDEIYINVEYFDLNPPNKNFLALHACHPYTPASLYNFAVRSYHAPFVVPCLAR